MTRNIFSHLHDAELHALSIDRQAWSVSLCLHSEEGVSYTLIFQRVVAVRCTDLLLQNVVSRVLSSKVTAFDAEQLSFWVDWVTSQSDAPSWLDTQHRNELVAACQSGSQELLVFEPSCGAQIALICESVSIS